MNPMHDKPRPMPQGSGMWLSLLLTLSAAVGFQACGTDSEAEPTVTIVTPANGTTVVGPKVKLQVKTTGFTYAVAGAGKVSAAQHDEDAVSGHIHVFLDKPEGLDADAITDLTKYDTTTLTITTAGEHYIIVAGADAKHGDVESMLDSVKFTVTLP
ncbi:MAG: hypothetical protein JWP91_4088 [Fibrobacteres bacterium]|nr:hypothetical protein [Fibrobacterota bacterium]